MRSRGLLKLVWSLPLGVSLVACEPAPNSPEPAAATHEPATAEPPPTATPDAPSEAPSNPPPKTAEPPAPVGSSELAPLPQEARDAFASVRADRPPAHIVRDTHYFISNEQSHFLWREHIADVGGAFIGVGTDQNYLLAAWAKSTVLILADFDGSVVDLHRVYGLMFEHAATPQELLSLWSAEQETAMVERIRDALDPAHRDGAVLAYQQARALVHERLTNLDAQYRGLEIPTFLSDAAQYDHLRTLWRNGRVVTVLGDLTADSALVGLGDALRTADIEVGVLYLSNAEQYLKYTPQFRRNIIGLPMAENGVVVRTNGWKQFRYVDNEEYHYNVQPARGFAQWMAEGHAWGLPPMLKHRTKTDVRGLSLLVDPPPKVPGRRPPLVAPQKPAL